MAQFTIMRFTNTASIAYVEADNSDEALAKADNLSDSDFTIADTEFYNTVVPN